MQGCKKKRISIYGENQITNKSKKINKPIKYFLLFIEGYDLKGRHFINLLYTTKKLNLLDLVDEIETSYKLTNVQINGWNEINRRQVEIWLGKRK